jgi:hypothetical protein
MEAPDHVEIVDCHRRNCEPDLLGKPRSSNLIKPTSLTQNALPRAIGVPPRRINEIFPGKRSVTAGTGLRLAPYFQKSEGLGSAFSPTTTLCTGDGRSRQTWNGSFAGTCRLMVMPKK